MESCRVVEQKVVVHTSARGVVKGFLQSVNGTEMAPHPGGNSLPDVLHIRSSESDQVHQVPLKDAKAVFFVETFEGQDHRRDVRFYTQTPMYEAVWVQAEFYDGEILEGLVPNTLQHLTEPGLCIIPSDPSSNNLTVYVLKSSLKDYRILGVRKVLESAKTAPKS